MPSLPKLFSLVILALVLFGGLRPEMGLAVVLGLLGLAAALDAGAGLRAGGAAEQVRGWLAGLVALRVLPFHLAVVLLACLAWPQGGAMPGPVVARNASAGCLTCGGGAGTMCGAEGRAATGGCGQKAGGGGACGCSSKAAAAAQSTRAAPARSAPRLLAPPERTLQSPPPFAAGVAARPQTGVKPRVLANAPAGAVGAVARLPGVGGQVEVKPRVLANAPTGAVGAVARLPEAGGQVEVKPRVLANAPTVSAGAVPPARPQEKQTSQEPHVPMPGGRPVLNPGPTLLVPPGPESPASGGKSVSPGQSKPPGG